MAPIKLLIIGAGIVGKRRAEIALKHPSMYTLMGFVDIDPNVRAGLGRSFDDLRSWASLDEVDIEFDAAAVCLPNKYAPSRTIQLIQMGKSVLCEKPPARNLLELRAVEKEVDKQAKLVFGFNHRFHDSVSDAFEIIDSGELGEVINLKGVYGKSGLTTFGQTEWRCDRDEAGGGVLLDQGIHLLDIMNQMTSGLKVCFSKVKNSYWNYDVEDNAYVVMEDNNGVVAVLHSSATQWDHLFRLEITLTKGSVMLSGILSGSRSYGDETIKISKRSGSPSISSNDYVIKKYSQDPSWEREMTAFYKYHYNLGENNLMGSIESALAVMTLIEDIYLKS